VAEQTSEPQTAAQTGAKTSLAESSWPAVAESVGEITSAGVQVVETLVETMEMVAWGDRAAPKPPEALPVSTDRTGRFGLVAPLIAQEAEAITAVAQATMEAVARTMFIPAGGSPSTGRE